MDTDKRTEPAALRPTFVRYSEDLEQRRPDEDVLIDKIVRALRRNNEWAASKHKHAIRDAHAKGFGMLLGELTVYPNLPNYLRQGLFATPATYPVIIRLSSTSGAIRSDQVRGVRGMAMKVLGVHGARIVPEDGNTTQDFVFVNNDTFPFADMNSYAGDGMRAASILARSPDIALEIAGHLSALASRILAPLHVSLPSTLQLIARANNHVLGETYHTAAPLRYGEYVAKMCIAPLSDSVGVLTGRRISRSEGDDAQCNAVAEFFAHNSADYEVRVQRCTDPARMPIEDATVSWSENESPHIPVARIRLPRQSTNSPTRRAYSEDVLSFNSWNGLADHRPLGSINRLKLEVYNASSEFRHHYNKIDRVEPSDTSDVPK